MTLVYLNFAPTEAVPAPAATAVPAISTGSEKFNNRPCVSSAEKVKAVA